MCYSTCNGGGESNSDAVSQVRCLVGSLRTDLSLGLRFIVWMDNQGSLRVWVSLPPHQWTIQYSTASYCATSTF